MDINFKCKLGIHTWNGCVCSKCGAKRDSDHQVLTGTTCSVCGKNTRNTANNVIKTADSQKGHIDNEFLSETEFVANALKKSAYCKVPVSRLGSITSDMAQSFLKSGISTADVSELFNNSLLAICPVCHDYISGGALLMLDVFSMAGNVMFTGNSGGAERLVEGKCKSYSCYSKSYDLYWCPDLDQTMLNEIRIQHRINIDADIQKKRDHIWKPC